MNSSVDSEPDPSRSLKHVYSYFYTYVHTFTHCHSKDNACMRRLRNGNCFLYFEHRVSDYLWIYGKICKFSLNCHYKILKKNFKDYLVIKKLHFVDKDSLITNFLKRLPSLLISSASKATPSTGKLPSLPITRIQ